MCGETASELLCVQHKHDTVNVGRAELITGTLLEEKILNIGWLHVADEASVAHCSRMWVGRVASVRQTQHQHLEVMKCHRRFSFEVHGPLLTP